MKVALSNVTSGTNVSAINDNFTLIQDALNNGALWRTNPVGEPNQMTNLLDMNANRIVNLPPPISDTEPVRLIDFPIAAANIPFKPLLVTVSQLTPSFAAIYNNSVVMVTDRNNRLASSTGTYWVWQDGSLAL